MTLQGYNKTGYKTSFKIALRAGFAARLVKQTKSGLFKDKFIIVIIKKC
jgi:hypothetical protein